MGALARTRREEQREPGWDLKLTELVECQHGVVARRQLRELGFGKDAIQHRIASGRPRLKEGPEGHTRSKLEERFGPFLRRHHLPQPRFNDWITAGGKRCRVDCHWPGTWQIVELDGWQAHKSRTAFREDRARDRRLRVAGYSVTHITWNQLDDEPEAIAADLRSLLKHQAV